MRMRDAYALESRVKRLQIPHEVRGEVCGAVPYERPFGRLYQYSYLFSFYPYISCP